ncbi:carboxymuconolactone decarboxylase family protein [Actinomadura madurae]|uniref:carboxymuconolactone decarboxylase family protein n=1 Tax=Actinomadura madurae TaxID=1993 RepID=UPI002026FA98|nr:carboxymuconolactone decarboxylase family protein [Actinomadura madurae]URM97241.1 carboxymuconolactone decarboxylase family protein [Actinomadura madurae]
MTQYPTRVSPVDLDGLSGRQEAVRIKMGPYGESGTSTMMKTFLNYPEFARSIGRIGTRVTLTSDLPPRLAGLASLRTAWLCDSEYLWSQHRKASLKLGVTDEGLFGVAEGPESSRLESFDRVVVSTVDDMYYRNRISDENWKQFDQFGPEGVTDLILVYGLYVLQSCVARNFGTTLEEGSVGYLPELDRFRDRQQRTL